MSSGRGLMSPVRESSFEPATSLEVKAIPFRSRNRTISPRNNFLSGQATPRRYSRKRHRHGFCSKNIGN
jgi:hypothetical protein